MQIELGGRVIDCTNHTAIMAVLNVGTDSPVAGSIVAPDDALRRAAELRDAGAEIIDIGAHSTRSAGEAVTPQAEIDRLCPVVEALHRDGQLVSVDTWTAQVARAAAAAGADIINDVTAASDPAMAAVATEFGLPVIVMHMRGRPKQHRAVDQHYDDVAGEVRDFLADRARALSAAGVPQVWVDPGFEFAKSAADNVRMLIDMPNIVALGHPVVISASRKGFLAELLGQPKLRSTEVQGVAGLLEATLAFNTLAAYLGAHVVRVHDVAAVAAALRVVDAVRRRP